MKLVIGGYSQGKLDFVKREYQENSCVIFQSVLPDEGQMQVWKARGKKAVVNDLHRWVREQMLQKADPEEELAAFLEQNPESVIISDEIGNGIVPMDPFEREYRERAGRILVKLADEADEVVRVICGIGQRIK